MACEELRKLETILFEKETREYDFETKAREQRQAVTHLKRTTGEKEDELRCLRDEIKRKQTQIEDDEERITRDEDEIEDETACTRYVISELRKKLEALRVKHDETEHRHAVLNERLKLEGKIELELASLEFGHSLTAKQRESDEQQWRSALNQLREKEEALRAKEAKIRKREISMR